MVKFNTSSPAGLKELNDHLSSRSYIDGYIPSQSDVEVFQSISGAPNKDYPHVLRWFNHVKSFDQGSRSRWAGSGAAGAANGAVGGDEEDEFDPFADSDEEDDAEKERIREERLAKYAEKKAKKPETVAKSTIILDVKPWDDEVDMKKLEEEVRKIETDGLLWGASKLVPVAYGIKKLQIGCVVEDDKVGTDFLEESITALEDYVQSVDIAAFQKI